MIEGSGDREQFIEQVVLRIGLSSRLAETVFYLRCGASNRSIARYMGISPNTVRSYLREIFRHLGVGRRTEVVALIDDTLGVQAVDPPNVFPLRRPDKEGPRSSSE